MVTASRPATFDELDAVKKTLAELTLRVDRVVTGLNAALRSAQQNDHRIEAAMRAADAANRRTEHADFTTLARLAALDLTILTRVAAGWGKIVASVKKLEHDAGHH